MEWQSGDFTISTDKARLDLDSIHAWLSSTYWAEGIPRETVERSLQHSLVFGIYTGQKQVGLARVVSDFATFAYLGDVFIDEQYRGQSLGKWLIETIISHPDLQGLRNWHLATRDAHGLYEQFGFKTLDDPKRIMRRHDPDVYKRAKPTQKES